MAAWQHGSMGRHDAHSGGMRVQTKLGGYRYRTSLPILQMRAALLHQLELTAAPLRRLTCL